MVGHADRLADGRVHEQVAQMGARVAARVAVQTRRQAEHLVEVAVVQIALPVDADLRVAHHGAEVVGLVGALEQLHVGLERALAHQGAAETLDRHVGERVEPVERDAEVRLQLAFVVGFKRRLRRRQRWPLRVVDEVEHEAGAGLRVAERIELLQGGDALVEHTLAALAVDVLDRVARHRGDHLDALRSEKFGQPMLARLEKDRQVATVDHVHAGITGGHHQAAEMLVQLGCTAGEVERFDAPALQHLEHQVDGGCLHHLGAVRAGIHVAVQARLIALVAEVDLQRVEVLAAQGREVGAGQ